MGLRELLMSFVFFLPIKRLVNASTSSSEPLATPSISVARSLNILGNIK